MSDVAGANQPPQLNRGGATENEERECAIIEIPSRGLRDDDNFKFRLAARQAKLSKATSQRKCDGLNASDAWREKMTVNQKLHNQDPDDVSLKEEQRKRILPFSQLGFSLQPRAVMFVRQYSDIADDFDVLSWPECKRNFKPHVRNRGHAITPRALSNERLLCGATRTPR